MPVDDNRWIVSSYRFFEHTSPVTAEAERERLSEMFPKKRFRLYRLKRVIMPLTDDEKAMMDELASWTADPLMVDESEAWTADPLSDPNYKRPPDE